MHNLQIGAIVVGIAAGTYLLLNYGKEGLIDNVPYSRYWGIKGEPMEGFDEDYDEDYDEDANGSTRSTRRRSRSPRRSVRRGGARRRANRTSGAGMRARSRANANTPTPAAPPLGVSPTSASDMGVNVMTVPPRGAKQKPCVKDEPNYWAGQEKGPCIKNSCINTRGTIPYNSVGTNKVRMLKPISDKRYQSMGGPVFQPDKIVTGLAPGANPLMNKNFINATQGHYIVPENPVLKFGVKDIRGNPKLHLTKTTHCFENIYDERDLQYVGINYGNM
jgi:hypothetical protein